MNSPVRGAPKIGVYAIECAELKSVYVGASKNIRNRHYHHKNHFKANKHQCNEMQDAWNRGLTFDFKIIKQCLSGELLENETFVIKEYVSSGWHIYNKMLTTNNLGILNIPRKYIPVVTDFIRAMELGKVNHDEMVTYMKSMLD